MPPPTRANSAIELAPNEKPVRTLLYELRKDLTFAKAVTYEQLFHQQRAPIGHYVFTDHDRLSAYECEIAVGCLELRHVRYALEQVGCVLEKAGILH